MLTEGSIRPDRELEMGVLDALRAGRSFRNDSMRRGEWGFESLPVDGEGAKS
jgi:hypothetical protein